MAGIIVPLFSRTLFNFSNLAASATSTQIIANAINIASFDFVGLSVRLHEKNLGANVSIKITGRSVDPTNEDPADFALGTDVAPVTITNATSAPSLNQSTQTGSGAGPYLRVILIATQYSTVQTILAGLSATLWLREK